jgi:hypothetical protein
LGVGWAAADDAGAALGAAVLAGGAAGWQAARAAARTAVRVRWGFIWILGGGRRRRHFTAKDAKDAKGQR